MTLTYDLNPGTNQYEKLSGQTNFTVSAWIRTSPTLHHQTIIQQRDVNRVNGQYTFKVRDDGTLIFWVYGDQATQYSISRISLRSASSSKPGWTAKI